VPDNIEILQNTLWRVAAEEAATDKYPEYFQSMSVKNRKDRVVHGLHYAVFPKDRMLLDDFKASVANLKHRLCVPDLPVHESGSTGIGVRADSGDGGAGFGGGNGEGGGGDSEAGGSASGSAAKATDSAWSTFKTAMPACSYMRLVCEALHAFCEADSTEPTDAMFAYLLLHDIGAADSDITRLMYDTSEARLAYRAVKLFKDPGTIGINVGGDIYDMCKLLETVLPRFLHQKNPLSESEDEDEDGASQSECGLETRVADLLPKSEVVEKPVS
jgi:hypothetical protein